MSAQARKKKLKRGERENLSLCLTVSVSLFKKLLLALPLCIIFTSLAFQKSYLYESYVAAALVSLPLLGYETRATQPPHARLSSGLSKEIPLPIKFTKHTLSQSCEGNEYSRMYVRTSKMR